MIVISGRSFDSSFPDDSLCSVDIQFAIGNHRSTVHLPYPCWKSSAVCIYLARTGTSATHSPAYKEIRPDLGVIQLVRNWSQPCKIQR